jgi:hypothetical protein
VGAGAPALAGQGARRARRGGWVVAGRGAGVVAAAQHSAAGAGTGKAPRRAAGHLLRGVAAEAGDAHGCCAWRAGQRRGVRAALDLPRSLRSQHRRRRAGRRRPPARISAERCGRRRGLKRGHRGRRGVVAGRRGADVAAQQLRAARQRAHRGASLAGAGPKVARVGLQLRRVAAQRGHDACVLAARRRRGGLPPAGHLVGRPPAGARNFDRQRAWAARASVARRRALVVAAAQAPPASLRTGRAVAVTAAALAGVPLAGAHLSAPPLAPHPLLALHRLGGFAAGARLLHHGAAGLRAGAGVTAFHAAVHLAGQQFVAGLAAGRHGRVAGGSLQPRLAARAGLWTGQRARAAGICVAAALAGVEPAGQGLGTGRRAPELPALAARQLPRRAAAQARHARDDAARSAGALQAAKVGAGRTNFGEHRQTQSWI